MFSSFSQFFRTIGQALSFEHAGEMLTEQQKSDVLRESLAPRESVPMRQQCRHSSPRGAAEATG